MANSDSSKMILLYIHDRLKKRNLHKSAEVLATEANLHPQDGGVMIDTPEGFLLEWFNLLCEECRTEREKLRRNSITGEDTSSSRRFLLTWLPIFCSGLVLEWFPPFYSEYCVEIAKHVSEDSSSQAIEDNAGNVPLKLDFMDREIAKKALWKITLDQRMF